MTNSKYTARGMNALEEFSSDMERVFDSLFGRTPGSPERACNAAKFAPLLDVIETNEAFEISVDLPGVNPADVTLEMNEGKLTISGQRVNPATVAPEDNDKNYHRMERNHGTFFRAVAIPNDVDVARIDARYELGVLHVRVPKSEKPQPTKIEIRTA
jgi:HSP20 family protein